MLYIQTCFIRFCIHKNFHLSLIYVSTEKEKERENWPFDTNIYTLIITVCKSIKYKFDVLIFNLKLKSISLRETNWLFVSYGFKKKISKLKL